MKQNIRPKVMVAVTIVASLAAVILSGIDPGLNQTSAVAGGLDEAAIAAAGSNGNAAPGSCTILTVSKGDTVFFGNNEDWINPNTYIWSREAPPDGYSAVFFGFDNLFPQGGVNEKGLAYDVNSLPEMPINPHPERRPAPDRFGEYLLAKSATVEEAIATIMGFSWGSSFGGQFHLADASGDAAVVSAGVDGELVATRKRPGSGYLVSTNFNLAVPEVGSHPCERYDTATAMLEQVMLGDRLGVDDVADVLDATHQEGVDVNTVYANAVDLSSGVIYLYHWYQFDEAVALNVPTAIERFTEPTPIRTLFSPETVAAAETAHNRHTAWVALINSTASIWLALVALSIPIQLWLTTRRRQEVWHERLAWLASTLFLGPISLAAQFARWRSDTAGTAHTGDWRRASLAALVWSGGYSLGWLLAVPYFVIAGSDISPTGIFVAVYVMPLMLGLLLLRGVPYATRVGGAYFRGLRSLALAEWIAHNLVSGAMIAVFSVLVTQWFPDGIQVDPLVWLAFGLSTLAGTLAVLPFMGWMAHRGVTLWPWRAVAGADGSLPAALSLQAGWPALALSLGFVTALALLTVSQLGV